ncbi:MAG: aminodeoxychorismate/anthranilate synthase component II [Saprospiraceae bacterium]
MASILIIDNYDSFTYNLYHLVRQNTSLPIDIYKNDELPVSKVIDYDYIIISPGPDLPDKAGITKQVITSFGSHKKILGVCLGHQAIGEVYGASLKLLPEVKHGQQTKVIQTSTLSSLFKDLPPTFEAGRYHSWVINPNEIRLPLIVTAKDEDGQIMAIQHKTHEVYGVQFHPESIMTPLGHKMIQNFIK